MFLHSGSDSSAGAMSTIQHRADFFDHELKVSPCRECGRWSTEFPGCHMTAGCALRPAYIEPMASMGGSNAEYGRMGGRPRLKRSADEKRCVICGGWYQKPYNIGAKMWAMRKCCGRACGVKYGALIQAAYIENAKIDGKRGA